MLFCHYLASILVLAALIDISFGLVQPNALSLYLGIVLYLIPLFSLSLFFKNSIISITFLRPDLLINVFPKRISSLMLFGGCGLALFLIYKMRIFIHMKKRTIAGLVICLFFVRFASIRAYIFKKDFVERSLSIREMLAGFYKKSKFYFEKEYIVRNVILKLFDGFNLLMCFTCKLPFYSKIWDSFSCNLVFRIPNSVLSLHSATRGEGRHIKLG